MRNRMLFLMTTAAAFVFAAPLLGQKHGGGDPCKRLEKHTQWMKDSLGLTANQESEIQKIKSDACDKLTLAKNETGDDKEAFKEKAKVIMKETHQSIATVLNDEQKALLKAHKHKGGMKEGGSKLTTQERAQKMTEKMKTELGLTESQVALVLTANEEMLSKREQLREKKKSGADTAALKAENKQIAKDYQAKMKEILSKEQMAKLKEMRKEKKKNHPGKGHPKTAE